MQYARIQYLIIIHPAKAPATRDGASIVPVGLAEPEEKKEESSSRYVRACKLVVFASLSFACVCSRLLSLQLLGR
jgi:hypothetical protein